MTVGTQVTTTAGPAEGARVDHDKGGFGRHKTYPSGTMAGAVTGMTVYVDNGMHAMGMVQSVAVEQVKD